MDYIERLQLLCYSIHKDEKTGNSSLRFCKNNLIYNSSLLYSFHQDDSIYFIDEKYNLFDFDIATGKTHYIYSLKEKIQKRAIMKLPEYPFDEQKPSLLIIDEEIEMLWFIGETFVEKFNIIPLQDSLKTDEILNKILPVLIIFDVTKSKDKGIELTKKLKSRKETAHIPLIIISGQHEKEEQVAFLSVGAEIYITQPFNPEYLRVSVNQLLERKEVLKDYFHSPISSFERTEGRLTHKESKLFLQSILNIISENLRNPELSPRFIAEKFAISTRSLYRKMEEIGDSTPTDLIRECRLHVAEDLLLTTKKTIDEIVFEAGFANKVTFFKVFREKYDCTPKKYRMMHLKDIQV